ncbi:MAG: OmpA family protein [Kastovskya adunca ATA6-11-RM4]|nr:OmpA family protein [Kastovskya adunca ATA6-11-RM4]
MTQSARTTPNPSSGKPKSRPPWILVLIFRLLLLGVGSGLAIILGILIANFYPHPNPSKPLILRLPERFSNEAPVDSTLVNAPPGETSSSLPPLTPVQRQQLQTELNQLQSRLKALSDRTTTLENQLDTNRQEATNRSIEERLQSVSLQLQGLTTTSNNNPSATNTTSESDTVLKVTLPNDVLFKENSVLRPEAGLILDKIVADIRNVENSTIRIAAHTDSEDPQNSRELSFRRAKAVEQYLARALGQGYRWVVIGYGQTRPIVPNDTSANQQRNRRIEIAVAN